MFCMQSHFCETLCDPIPVYIRFKKGMIQIYSDIPIFLSGVARSYIIYPEFFNAYSLDMNIHIDFTSIIFKMSEMQSADIDGMERTILCNLLCESWVLLDKSGNGYIWCGMITTLIVLVSTQAWVHHNQLISLKFVSFLAPDSVKMLQNLDKMNSKSDHSVFFQKHAKSVSTFYNLRCILNAKNLVLNLG